MGGIFCLYILASEEFAKNNEINVRDSFNVYKIMFPIDLNSMHVSLTGSTVNWDTLGVMARKCWKWISLCVLHL